MPLYRSLVSPDPFVGNGALTQATQTQDNGFGITPFGSSGDHSPCRRVKFCHILPSMLTLTIILSTRLDSMTLVLRHGYKIIPLFSCRAVPLTVSFNPRALYVDDDKITPLGSGHLPFPDRCS